MVVDTKLYEILGVEPTASNRELKKAFMIKARQLHPDKNQDDPNATEKFQELNEAYEVLKDPERRKIYDEYGPEGLREGAGQNADFGDILSHLFGFNTDPNARPKTRNIIKEIPATLEELYNGAEKKITIERHVVCKKCNGTGTKDGKEPPVCETCDGQGQVLGVQTVHGMQMQSVMPCPKCHGHGKIVDEKNKCPECDGEAIVLEEKEFICQIERGMKDGSKIVFRGESDNIPGADPGNVVIYIREESHPVFVRRNDDLLIEKDITLTEAFYGAKFVIDTLDNRKLFVETDPNQTISYSMVKAIDREGMPIQGNSFNRGQLFVQFNIVFPKREALTEEFKQALLKVQPVEKLDINLDDENVYPVTAQDAQVEDFTENRAEHSERRHEAVNSSDEDEDEGFYEEGDEEGQNVGCQPM